MRGGTGERVGAVARAVDDVSGPVEVPGDDLGDGRVVVDDEDPGPGSVRILLLLHGASLAPCTRERRPRPPTSVFRKEPSARFARFALVG